VAHRACPAPALEFFQRWGEVPLPPYIRRRPDHTDPRALPEHLCARARARSQPPNRQPALRRGRCSRRWQSAGVNRAPHSPLPRRGRNLSAAAQREPRGAYPCMAERALGERGHLRGDSRAPARRGGPRRSARRHHGCAAPPRVPRPWPRTAARHPRPRPWLPGPGDTRLFITPGFRFQVSDAAADPTSICPSRPCSCWYAPSPDSARCSPPTAHAVAGALSLLPATGTPCWSRGCRA